MLLTSLLALAPLLGFVLSAESPINHLAGLAAATSDGVIRLDPKTFEILTAPSRNWSTTIHFTALDPKRKCGPCRSFEPSYNAVSKAWKKVPKAQRDTHFFATLDFDDGPTVFQTLGMQSAPVVYVYPATEGDRKVVNPKAPFAKYDFSNGFEPLPLAESLSKHTIVPIPYKDPIDWTKWGSALATLLPLSIAARYAGPFLTSRWLWALVTITTSLVMTGGLMFVKIRGTPERGHDGSWIAAGFQNQYGQEVQVVAGIYGLLSASFLMLALVTPLQTSARRQRTQVYLWSAVIFVVFSILVSIFKVKNRAYPFKLLF